MAKRLKNQSSWVERRMKTLGINQEHLAAFLKVSQPTVSRVLASFGTDDAPKLDPDRMQRLCVALRIDASLVELVRFCQPDKVKSLHDLIEEWNQISKK